MAKNNFNIDIEFDTDADDIKIIEKNWNQDSHDCFFSDLI